MSLEADLQILLKAETTVTTIVAGNPRAANDKCIRRERLFQSDQLPAIEIHIEDDQVVNDLSGWNGTTNAHVVLSCAAEDQGTARDLAAACIEVLEPFRGATASGVLDSVTYLRSRNAFYPYEDGSDAGEHVTEVHFRIWYRAGS